MRRLVCQFYIAILLVLPNIVQADVGPRMKPLEVRVLYSANGRTSMYVEFSDGAMPGCYNDRGGYCFFLIPISIIFMPSC